MAEMIVGHNALKGIREAVQADIDSGEHIYILGESESEFTVVDDTEGTDRTIRYISHDKITSAWLEGKIVITYSAGWYDQTVDPRALAEYLFKTVGGLYGEQQIISAANRRPAGVRGTGVPPLFLGLWGRRCGDRPSAFPGAHRPHLGPRGRLE